jgi:hypothetical protein
MGEIFRRGSFRGRTVFVAKIMFWDLVKAYLSLYKKTYGYFIGLQHKSKLKVILKFQPNQLQNSIFRILCLGGSQYTAKKRLASFPSPARMSLSKCTLADYSWPGRVLIVTSRLGTGKSLTFFYGKDVTDSIPLC